MYVSRLNFYTIPGKSGEVEQQLKDLRAMVERQGSVLPRILHTHFASLGAPDIVFEQEAAALAALEEQITKVVESSEFQNWSSRMSTLLMQSPKREVYLASVLLTMLVTACCSRASLASSFDAWAW
jgi:hypothetical protein